MSWPGVAFLRELDQGRAGPAGPRLYQVVASAPVCRLLERYGVSPAAVVERELAAVAGDELIVPLFGWRLTPVGAWGLPSDGGRPCLGPGWAMDPGALR